MTGRRQEHAAQRLVEPHFDKHCFQLAVDTGGTQTAQALKLEAPHQEAVTPLIAT